MDDPAATLGAFTVNVNDLAQQTSYSFVAFASNSIGTSYTSPVSTFTTTRLATAFLVEGPAAGSDAILVLGSGAWTAQANASWLHTRAGGSGSSWAQLSFDANPGATRTGTLTIAGATLTITQAGSGYLAGNPTPISLVSTGSNAWGVGVDASGNVSSGLNNPQGVAVDGSGNVYFADAGNHEIKELPRALVPGSAITENAAAGSDALLPVLPATLPLTGVLAPSSDQTWLNPGSAANGVVSFSFTANTGSTPRTAHLTVLGQQITVTQFALPTLTAPTAASITGTKATLGGTVAGDGGSPVTKRGILVAPTSRNANLTLGSTGVIEVDAGSAGKGSFTVNVKNLALGTSYSFVAFASSKGGTSYTTPVSTFTTLAGPTVTNPASTAVTPTTATLGGIVSSTGGAAITRRGILYAVASNNPAPTLGGKGVIEVDDVSAGTGSFTEKVKNLKAGTTYAFVAFASNSVATTYTSPVSTFTTVGLASYSLVEAPTAGSDSDQVLGSGGAWTATSNASWLHTTASGSGPAAFSFDANPGGTRTGTLTIAGLTLTITQAARGSVALATLVSSGLSSPQGVAVDTKGNVFISDTASNSIKEWTPARGITTLVSSGLSGPWGLAVDRTGNVYIADTFDNAIKERNAKTGLTTLVSSGLNWPIGVAVDGTGNVYIADNHNNAIKKWNAQTGLTTLVSSGLNFPEDVAVDGTGNLYIADTRNNAIKEWNAQAGLTTLVSSGLDFPRAAVVDAMGNVYIADTNNNAIKEWNARTRQVSTLVSSMLSQPNGVAVDGTDNVYIADTFNNAIRELPQGFQELPQVYISASSFTERSAAGSDMVTVVPTSQPLTGRFAPSSDQKWLTITSVAKGVIHFSFTANTSGAARSANLIVLGRKIGVTQVVASPQVDPAATSTAITGTTATLGGTVTSDGGGLSKRGILIAPTATNSHPTLGGAGVVEVDDASTGSGSFTVDVNDLLPVTGYSFVAFASNALGTSYSSVSTFTTLTSPPTVTSPTVTNVTSTTATLGGSIISDGGATITKVGFLYAPYFFPPGPFFPGSIEVDLAPAGTGAFTTMISGLNPGTTYHFYFFARNSAGESFTQSMSFTTLPSTTTALAGV